MSVVGVAGDGLGGVGLEIRFSVRFFPRWLHYLAYVFCTSPIAWARFTLDWLKR